MDNNGLQEEWINQIFPTLCSSNVLDLNSHHSQLKWFGNWLLAEFSHIGVWGKAVRHFSVFQLYDLASNDELIIASCIWSPKDQSATEWWPRETFGVIQKQPSPPPTHTPVFYTILIRTIVLFLKSAPFISNAPSGPNTQSWAQFCILILSPSVLT